MLTLRLLIFAACAIAAAAAASGPPETPAEAADSVRPPVVRGAAQEKAQGGRLIVILPDVSGSTGTTDPAGAINSAVPAAAYVSNAAATYVGTFAGAAAQPRPVEAADEAALARLSAELAAVPREGATATAAAVASCLDLLERAGAASGSACLVLTDVGAGLGLGHVEPGYVAQDLERIDGVDSSATVHVTLLRWATAADVPAELRLGHAEPGDVSEGPSARPPSSPRCSSPRRSGE